MEKKSQKRLNGKAPTRRAFLQQAAGTGIATVAGIALLSRAGDAAPFDYITLVDQLRNQASASGGQAVAGEMGGDAAILNFALILERLEATFYNMNADQPYLTSSTAVTNPGTTSPSPTVPGTGATIAGVGGTTVPGGTGTAGGTGTTGTSTAVGGASGTTTAPLTTSSAIPALKSIVDEIRADENTHVALLEGILGPNAIAAPTFQNLNAPTLQQFLNMAQMFEDIGVSAYVGAAPLIQDKGILATAAGILGVEGRHAGAIRAWEKTASTAEGGNPNLTITEDGQAVNPSRSETQVATLVAPFIVGGFPTIQPTTGTTTPSTPTTGTTTPTGTTGTTTPTTTTGTTTTPAGTTGTTTTVPTTGTTTTVPTTGTTTTVPTTGTTTTTGTATTAPNGTTTATTTPVTGTGTTAPNPVATPTTAPGTLPPPATIPTPTTPTAPGSVPTAPGSLPAAPGTPATPPGTLPPSTVPPPPA